LGLSPDDITVNLEIDTQKDQWSIASGTYSCRFSPGTAVAMHLAAQRIRDKLIRIAAKQLNSLPEDVELADGKARSKSNPDNSLPFARVAGTAHWSPVMLPEGMEPGLRETATWCPPELEPPSKDDRINTSLTYGFVFDMCGIEIDPVTYQVRIDRYISMHDAGTLLNPLIAEGQMHGAFVQGLAAALFEEFVYDERGTFKSGTFADYLVPTASEIPKLELMHIETPSPLTPLGAKGLAEGNCMSVPACVANAVADALGVKDVFLPISPRRVHELVADEEAEPPEEIAPRKRDIAAATESGREITGTGSFIVTAPPSEVWRSLLDPEALRNVIPGCRTLDREGENAYRAEVSLGVGPVRGRFKAHVVLSDLEIERAARLSGDLTGPLGAAAGGGHVRLTPVENGTRLDYEYAVTVSGTAAAVGGRLLDGAAEIIIRKFFEGLARYVGPKTIGRESGGGFLAQLWRGIRSIFGGAK
jgi:2-furoyl-CoA dehydrogenase large subunit